MVLIGANYSKNASSEGIQYKSRKEAFSC
jgi:hypothetical protein